MYTQSHKSSPEENQWIYTQKYKKVVVEDNLERSESSRVESEQKMAMWLNIIILYTFMKLSNNKFHDRSMWRQNCSVMDGVSFPFIYVRCDKDLEMKSLSKGIKEIEP